MNCKHVQEWLPLYVGRDLEEKRMKLVKAHLQDCADCASSAQEYRGAQQMLQRFAPPSFDETVYAGVRQRVLREIEREATTPTLLQQAAQLLQPRALWAFATALLLAVSLFSLYFIANRNERPFGSETVQQAKAGSASDHSVKAPGPDNSPAAASSPTPVKSPSQRPIMTAQRPRHSIRPAQAFVRPKHSVPDFAEPMEPNFSTIATAEKPLRVELQTKDQNIRIIWFSNPKTKQDSPRESSKGI